MEEIILPLPNSNSNGPRGWGNMVVSQVSPRNTNILKWKRKGIELRQYI